MDCGDGRETENLEWQERAKTKAVGCAELLI